MAKINISVDDISNVFKEKIVELQEEPEFQWSLARTTYETDEDGKPLVKLAVGNVPLDYDLWAGLRNPAVVGLHPAGLREIWEFYANRRRPRVDESGRQTIFQVPRSYDYARSMAVLTVALFIMRLTSLYIRANLWDEAFAFSNEGP